MNPDRARRIMRMAVMNGTLARPDRCTRCLKAGTPHGHHPDYSRPLDVVWLCVACHAAEHREERRVAPRVRRALKEPTTALARWMRDRGKRLGDLCREAQLVWSTARTYVDGMTTDALDLSTCKKISAWTGGDLTPWDVASCRFSDAAKIAAATEAA